MRRLVLAANDLWNVANFRTGLIAALTGAGWQVTVVAPDGPQREALRALGADVVVLPMQPRGQSPAADLALLLRYRRLLRRIAPDAFLGFTAKPNIWGSLAAHSLAIPVINNISGLGTAFIQGGRLQRLVSTLYRLALKRSATVFFQNEDDRDLFVAKWLVRAEQTALLPGSGVDLDRFQPRARGEGPFTFLLPARLIWDKGIAEYAAAARLVRARAGGKDVRVQLLGALEPPTPQSVPEGALAEWSADLDYLGAADDVRPLIAAADCIVLPSYREGLPRVLLEAAAMARPTIATDVPGCRDAIANGKSGLLCAPRSAEALAKAMERMLALTSAERSAMGEAGRRRVERKFDQRLVHRAYLDALGHLDIA